MKKLDFNSLKRCFIIAELSANHNGNIEIALETVRAAKRAGADAIKLQTYTADTITIDVKSDIFKIDSGTAWDGQYLYDLYQQAYTPWEWHQQIFDLAEQEGLFCFSSPFDHSAVDFLEQFNPPAYKIASFEITDIPLIRKVAATGRPIIISTGIADESDIELAIKTCREAGNNEICILKCTSSYPADPKDANLNTIPDIAKRFNVVPGLSDHTLGIEGPVVGVSLGARIIEKNIILDKSIGGADAHFSLDEKEFKSMVDAVRRAEDMLGNVDYAMTPKKIQSRKFSRSLFVVADIKAGEILTEQNVRSIRPGDGMHPKFLTEKQRLKIFPKVLPSKKNCFTNILNVQDSSSRSVFCCLSKANLERFE
jgi:pseudaminic acid synthase